MSMTNRRPDEYSLKLSDRPSHMTAENVFGLVWRTDFTPPGFCLLDAGPGVDSHTPRSWMVALKRLLSEVGARRGQAGFVYRSMARFDQQDTTKFHIDGGPD